MTTGADVAKFLTGRSDDPDLVALCQSAVDSLTALARRYTRGNGFTGGVPDEPIVRVITTAAARLAANPEQLKSEIGTAVMRGAFEGWSPLEKLVLDSYRGTAR